MGPIGLAKNMFGGFSSRIHKNIQKSMEIVECAGMLGNYSISKLKLYQNLTSTQRKNGSLSSLDSSIDSKRKNDLKIILH